MGAFWAARGCLRISNRFLPQRVAASITSMHLRDRADVRLRANYLRSTPYVSQTGCLTRISMSNRELPVVVPQGVILFPGVVAPIAIDGSAARQFLSQVSQHEQKRFVVAARRPDGGLLPVAVEVSLVRVLRRGEGGATVMVRGEQRVRLGDEVKTEPYLVMQVRDLPDVRTDGVEADALAMSVRQLSKQLIAVHPEIPDEAAQIIDQIPTPGALADAAAAHVEMELADRLRLLETTDVTERLRALVPLISRQIEVLKVKTEIDSQVQKDIGKNQREYLLRQRLKAIQEELGEGEDAAGDELEELSERLDAVGLSEEAAKVVKQQLARLKGMQPGASEYQVARTYLEWMADLPWSKQTEDRIDLAAARQVLDDDHHGLEKVKRRVLEFLAVRKLAPDKKGPILCLVGPPGVGKTSLGRSIAKTLGREMVRISLGGVRDEAEIRGHRRTYVGALPGRIIQSLKRAGTKNPIFVLDELDKLASDFRGDPSAALLEVLDPEQNSAFSDHYLEVPFDLSKVMFIATANQLDTIPPALRDRLEIIEVPGYTRAEKKQIALRHLVTKQLGEHGVTAEQAGLSDDALGAIIEGYTREAGVRDLERQLATVSRAIAVDIAAGTDAPRKLDRARVEEILGPPRFEATLTERDAEPGVATGLAWTPTGGEVLFVEATKMPGHGKLVLTGQLGDVMKESAQAAVSYTRSHALELGVDPAVFENSDIHIHLPAGGVPKDGPSAGVTLVTTVVSLLTGRRVHSDLAMTGEVTLRGRVLPVGGIKEKVLAAHRAGVKTVVLPERNRKDVLDIPEEVRAELDIRFAGTVADVLGPALEPSALLTPALGIVPLAPAILPANANAAA
jgi:ATP-dependent Lon protease